MFGALKNSGLFVVMEPIYKIKNLNFTYNLGKSNEYQALVNINIEIFPEEFIILFGPSGCGKSTVLNIVSGLEPPEEGTVFFKNKDISLFSDSEFVEYHRKTVGMIYQSYNLINSLTVLDNVALPQIFLSQRKKKREVVALEFLDRFGIKQQANKIPTELSGGQQQRIGIARAIVNDPEIVLADEPVGNLDSVSAENVLEILTELNEKEKKTIILVTHNPEFLEYGDRIFHLKDGMIIKETVNHDKGKHKKKKEEKKKAPTGALNDIMRAYSGLSPEQINILIMPYKAKLFSQHFITTRSLEEAKTFEDVMHRRLLNTISEEEFFNILHRPYFEGGVGFTMQTAEKIVSRVESIARMAEILRTETDSPKDDQKKDDKEDVVENKKKADEAVKYLMRTCFADYKHGLSDEQVHRLKQVIFDRVSNKIVKPELFTLLDKSFKEGGVGLNSKTARSVTEEIELIIILGYGMAGAVAPSSPIAPSDQAPSTRPKGVPAPGLQDRDPANVATADGGETKESSPSDDHGVEKSNVETEDKEKLIDEISKKEKETKDDIPAMGHHADDEKDHPVSKQEDKNIPELDNELLKKVSEEEGHEILTKK